MSSDLIETVEPGPRAVCHGWRPQCKDSLRGFCDIELPSGLDLCDVVLHESHACRWVSPAGIPRLAGERRQKIIDEPWPVS